MTKIYRTVILAIVEDAGPVMYVPFASTKNPAGVPDEKEP